MAKQKEKESLGLPADRKLAGDFRRVITAGRSVLKVQTVDEADAVALAQETADRLSNLPPEARLADRDALLSLVDDLTDLKGRMNVERAAVERKLAARKRHREADTAYRQGNPR